MLVHDNGNTWKVIKKTFKELGYKIYLNKDENGKESPILNASDYGVPQQRERIFLVGIRNDIDLVEDFTFPTPEKLTSTNQDFLDKNVPAK